MINSTNPVAKNVKWKWKTKESKAFDPLLSHPGKLQQQRLVNN